MAFPINVFIDNGYKEDDLQKIIEEVTSKSIRQNTKQISSECINSDQKQTISRIPWIPGVSPKLSKVFRKAGYKVVFKSNKNLQTILTSKNKTKLPNNSSRVYTRFRVPVE